MIGARWRKTCGTPSSAVRCDRVPPQRPGWAVASSHRRGAGTGGTADARGATGPSSAGGTGSSSTTRPNPADARAGLAYKPADRLYLWLLTRPEEPLLVAELNLARSVQG